MQKFIISISVLVVLAGCSGRDNLSDAYGNFETIEYLISAEGQGKIMEFNLKEGEALEKGQVVGYIDTVAIHLQVEQLQARIRAVEAQRSAVRAQTEVFQTQKKTLLVEKARLEKLLADKAATGKQLDDLNGQLAGLDAQIISTRTRYETIKAEIVSLQVQVEITRDQLSRNIFVNPVDGTVLEKYTESFEMAVPGKALYKIADLNTMILRVYISGDQLVSVKIGQEVGVIIDDNVSSEDPLKGRITWVSGKSEFTPKIIQTREERVKLVYAVKIEVSNDGRLKIGMPGEVIL